MGGTIRSQISINKNLGGVMAEILAGAVSGQNKAGERLLALSVDQAPYDEGDLIGTGTVVPAVVPGDDTIVAYDSRYARRLHEHPEYNFATDANPNAKGKFLEDPAAENKQELRDIIAKEARGA